MGFSFDSTDLDLNSLLATPLSDVEFEFSKKKNFKFACSGIDAEYTRVRIDSPTTRIQRFIQSNACIVVKSMKSRCLVCNHLINKLKKKN